MSLEKKSNFLFDNFDENEFFYTDEFYFYEISFNSSSEEELLKSKNKRNKLEKSDELENENNFLEEENSNNEEENFENSEEIENDTECEEDEIIEEEDEETKIINKKNFYINAEDQKKMKEMIEIFLEETNRGQNLTLKGQKIMNELFTKYIDKIILGIIQKKKYFKFDNLDDLINEGRLHAYKVIIEEKWNPEGASLFSFLTTVVSNNLLTYTIKQTKLKGNIINNDLSEIFNDKNLYYLDKDHEKKELLNNIFKILKEYFKNKKKKYYEITCLLERYCYEHLHNKFSKKDFIEYCKSYTFSPSLINTYFFHIRNIKEIKNFLKL